MGKVKKNLPQEENQKKISSFFQTGASKPVNSELFTHLGGKANQPKCTSKLSLKKTKTDTDKHRFTETKSKENISENKTGFGEVIDITSPQKEKEIITSPVFKKTNTNIKTCDKEPTVIPETQYFISPVTPTCKSRGDNKTVNSPSDDLLIIPDTPEDSTSEFGKKRKNFSRSFLIGSSSLGRRPGQKITPDHSKKTKKILHKKKNLISVSVNFNQSSEKLHSETSITKEEDSTNDYTEKSPEKFTDFCEDPNESFKEKEEKELQSPEKISEDSVKDTENLWHVDIDSDNSKNSENVEGDTPVKFNDSNSKFKRMSKPGLSPAAKKVNSQSNLDTADESDTTMTETKSPELEKEKVKRVLSLGVSNKRKLKSSNTSKLNAYQMSMNISNKKKNATDIKHVNLEDDDVLGEILQELKQTPKSTIVVSKGKSSKSPSVFTKNKDSLSSNRHKSLDHFDQSLTEEEMNYFSELDNQLHTKCITEENTSKQVVKEYPLLAYVKCTKYPEKTKNPTKKKKELSDKKGLNLAPDNKNLDKNSLKLAPDENNFDGNSMNLTPDDRESYLPCSLTSSAVIRNDDVECKIEECDTSRTLMIEGVVCDTSDILTSSCDVNKLEPTQNINEFSSQKSLVSSATDKGHSEMEIDEYNTQLDSQELCSEFKCLSPFKIRPEDDPFRMEPHCRQYGRHMVTNVEYTQGHQDMILTLTDCVTETTRYCHLTGFWADTHIQEDDIVHIVAKTDDQGNHKITDTDGLIIVNPDLLLSGTTVVSSVFCMRKSILNEKFKGCDSKNVQMLYGSIIHCVFQQVLQKKLVEEDKILLEAEQVVKQSKYLHEIYANNTTEGEVMEEIKKYIPPLLKWLEQYTNITQNLLCAQKTKTSDIAITKVKDIEENIWSPRFGIKGKIDLTVDVQLKNKNKQTERGTVPLELKTGRPTFSMEHKGQVSLYSMMSSDRREDPKKGLLLYLKEPDMKLIPVDHVNKRGLIQLRNEMAYYLSRKMSKVDSKGHVTYSFGKLPEPINNQRACVKCPQLLNCALYQKNMEHRSVHSGHAMSTLVPNSLSHILPSHMEYYTHWNLMLDLEMQSDVKKGHLKDIWCKTGIQREDVGDCISGLVLSTDNKDNSVFDSGVSIVKFCRHQQHPRFSSSLNLIGLSVDDYIIVSTENSNHIGLCTGVVRNITDSTVELITERESIPRLYELKSPIFRLDRCSSYNTASIFYSNLSRLMSDDANCTRLRELLIDKRKPEFVVKLSKSEIEKVKVIFKPLNKPQKTAILKVLMSTDYVLIKGYPGTGKTSTIVALVKVLKELGYSVLLTSYTHSAVDNILLKLKKDDVKFLRLGKISKIHPGIHEFAAENLTKKFTHVADLRQFYSEQKIVATTSLGTNHPLFTQRKFDICIVDEASQVLQPACLGPLFSAHKFVLVGDPKQLPPVVQCKEARNLGMDESLFSRLDDSGATYELNLQYRMNSEIMSLSNKLVYNGALQCGSDKVANGQLHLSHSDQTEKIYKDKPWIKDLFISEPYKAAILLDTDKVPAPENREPSGLIKNVTEAKIVYHLVQTLIKGGIDEGEIGVIAPYRNQVKIIREELSKTCNCVEVNTVDQYQGRDKRVIIISFTRCLKGSNQIETKSGELLNDIRRLNVAVTRAKEKLIMIGHKETLQLYQPMSEILSMLEEKNVIINLPETAGQ